MREALTSTDYFADVLSGDSWGAWRLILIAIMGEALADAERVTFRELTGRDREPGEMVDEFWGICGRRAGKTQAMAVLACYIGGCCDHRRVLAPGQRGKLPLMAATREQAGEAFNYILGAFQTAPNLRGLLDGDPTADTIRLTTRIDIEVRPASFRKARGFTAVAVLADECAFWYSENSANPDAEIINAVRPALATTGGPLVAISSPYARRGIIFEAFKNHHGPQGDPRILVVKAASKLLNAKLSQALVDRAYERDPAAASAEYGAEFRTDVETFVAREVVEAAVVTGRRELPPITGERYVGFVDPSGGSVDSMTLAIAHRTKDGVAVLDVVRERKPPFSPEAVVADFCEVLKAYNLAHVTGDRYAGEFAREPFRKLGIQYVLSEPTASDIFRDSLASLNSGKVELLDHARVVAQLCSLERKTTRNGKDVIGHPPGGHDDVAVSVCGAMLLAIVKRPPMVISKQALENLARMPPYPGSSGWYKRYGYR